MSDDQSRDLGGSLAGKTVFLHVGAPKTGTSYLQSRLTANRGQAGVQGMLWPVPWARQVQGARNIKTLKPGEELAADGPWMSLVHEAAAWQGPSALISMEWLVNAKSHQIAAAVESLAPARVEVVCTARDLVRTLPAAWQEGTQNLRTWPWSEYVEAVTSDEPSTHRGAVEFWNQHDIPRVVESWSAHVPADRIHVVTVPPKGSDPELLWDRFCSVLGLVGRDMSDAPSNNPSLGVVSARLMQRFNTVAKERGLPRQDYQRLAKHLLGKEILSQRRGAEGGIRLSDDVQDRLVRRAERMIVELEALPVHLVGDLDDLRPVRESRGSDPSEVTDSQMLDAAVDALVGLVEAMAARDRSRHPQHSGGDDLDADRRPARTASAKSFLGRLSGRIRDGR